MGAAGEGSALAETQNPVSGSELSSAATEPVPIVGRFENYEVMLDPDGKPIELGRGAMGVTYKALDVDLRCPVTLKVISEKYVGDESAPLRFLRESNFVFRNGYFRPTKDRFKEEIVACRRVQKNDSFFCTRVPPHPTARNVRD